MVVHGRYRPAVVFIISVQREWTAKDKETERTGLYVVYESAYEGPVGQIPEEEQCGKLGTAVWMQSTKLGGYIFEQGPGHGCIRFFFQSRSDS